VEVREGAGEHYLWVKTSDGMVLGERAREIFGENFCGGQAVLGRDVEGDPSYALGEVIVVRHASGIWRLSSGMVGLGDLEFVALDKCQSRLLGI
jgi:hypothetical protein